MADYNGLAPLLNTVSGMTAIVNGRQDDNTNTLSGVAWFNFNGTTASTLYVSSNSWVGFGVNAEQLKIVRRDGSMHKLYRQEGTLWNGYYQFLKLRWEGYSYYNSETDYHRLVWELFLISDGRLMLNIIRTPNGDDLGLNQLIADATVSFPVGYNGDAPFQYIFTPSNLAEGKGWSYEAHVPEVDQPYDRKYLIQDGSNQVYTVVDGVRTAISGGLTAANFREYGVDEIDANVMIGLTNPKLCYWQDSQDALPSLKLKVNAVPLVPQLVMFGTVSLSDAIKGVTITGDAESLYNVSFDGGTTWWKVSSGSWVQVTNTGDGCFKRSFEELNAAAWSSKVGSSIKFRVWLVKDGYLKSIRIDYV